MKKLILKRLICAAVLLCLVFSPAAYAGQTDPQEEIRSMTQEYYQMNGLMMSLLAGVLSSQGAGGLDLNSDSGKTLVQTLNVMLAQLVQQNKEAPVPEVSNILSLIVPLMQTVNGMLQPQAPAQAPDAK